MGWERRGRHTYYYRKRREGKRVVSEYAGAGIVGALSESQDEDARAQRAAIRRQRQEHAAIDRTLDDFGELANVLTRAVLIAELGTHTHKGEWRRKRKNAKDTRPKCSAKEL